MSFLNSVSSAASCQCIRCETGKGAFSWLKISSGRSLFGFFCSLSDCQREFSRQDLVYDAAFMFSSFRFTGLFYPYQLFCVIKFIFPDKPHFFLVGHQGVLISVRVWCAGNVSITRNSFWQTHLTITGQFEAVSRIKTPVLSKIHFTAVFTQ